VRLLAGIKDPSVEAVVPRRGGGVDLFGGGEKFGPAGGFALRLTASGRPDRRFGKNGFAKLGRHVVSAAAGGDGSAFLLFEHIPETSEPARPFAERMLGDGRLDPLFGGPAGLALPKKGRGAKIVSAAHGQATVFVEGWNYCSGTGECPSNPYLTRLIEPTGSHAGRDRGGNR
jgi:hypothetical protein